MIANDIKALVRAQCAEWAGDGYRVLDLEYNPAHRAMYRGASEYLGVSKNPDLIADDVRIGSVMHLIPSVAQSASACNWSVVDIDTAGNPYLILAQFARYAPEGIYSVALTDGNRRSMTLPQGSDYVRWVTQYPGENCRFLHRWYDDFVRWSLAEIPRAEYLAVRRASVDDKANATYYYAIRVKFTGGTVGISP